MKTILSKDGTPLAYDIYGSGPALIFITGATCFRLFEPVLHDVQVIAQEFTVYNYDRRGRGDSGNTLPYVIERELEDIEAMLEAAGGKAYLYGHSSGAILALEATLRLNGKVSKLVMHDPAYASDEADQNEFEKMGQELEALLAKGKNEEAISFFLQGIGLPPEVITGMQHSPQWATMEALAPTLAYDTRLASSLAPVERISQLTTPTLIVIGEESPPSIHEVAHQLGQALPKAERSQLAGQDHLADPEVLLPVLSSFLKQLH